eukprot:m51a1_g11023 putative ribose 5-phosphate isomerase (150) ;mRNA; r:409351-410070
MKIALGTDHGGFTLKPTVVDVLKKAGHEIIDVGTYDGSRCDYPDIAQAACSQVLSGNADRAILMCGTGIGISIAANKINGIRCALVHDHYTALMCRQHNDANVLAIGGRTMGPEVAKEVVEVFLSTAFLGEHHTARVGKISALECCKSK